MESLEHYVVSGLIAGPGGKQNLTAMVKEIGFPGATGDPQGDPIIVRLIQPLQMADDSASALMAALDFEAMVDYVAQWGYWRCVGQVILCEIYTAACIVGAPVCYAGCLALCTGSGPGYLILHGGVHNSLHRWHTRNLRDGLGLLADRLCSGLRADLSLSVMGFISQLLLAAVSLGGARSPKCCFLPDDAGVQWDAQQV